MIAVDTNLLVYAHREDSDFHLDALNALCGLAESGVRWSIPWPCIHEFIAVTTHPKIFDPPSPLPQALKSIEAWLDSPHCEMIGEEIDYFSILKRLATKGKIQGPMIHDARIAAICINNDVKELWSADRDFSRFSTLKVRNPMIAD